MTRYFDLVPGYESLATVYDSAIEQASEGKGRERHASEGEAYENQIICEVARRVGLGYPLGQAVKKIYESQRLDGERGVAELLGALNYVAAAVIVMQEGVDEECEEAVRDHEFLGKALSGEQAFQVGEHVQYRIAELSEGARWLDAWYLERHPNGRGHIVKSKAEGRIAVDPDKIRKAPKAEGREEPEFKPGDRVQVRMPVADGDRWDDAVCVSILPEGTGIRVDYGDYKAIAFGWPNIRHAPKAEGCEELVQKDAPQTPEEVCRHIVDCNPATFHTPSYAEEQLEHHSRQQARTPTGEELAEMAEEDGDA